MALIDTEAAIRSTMVNSRWSSFAYGIQCSGSFPPPNAVVNAYMQITFVFINNVTYHWRFERRMTGAEPVDGGLLDITEELKRRVSDLLGGKSQAEMAIFSLNGDLRAWETLVS